MTDKQNDLATQFLLGELSEEKRREVEERFLSDTAFFEELLAAEDALIDEYISGTLSEEQKLRARALFDSSPEQRQKVEFTSQLLARVKPRRSADELGPSPGIPVSALPAPYLSQRTTMLVWGGIALLFVVLGSWSIYLYNRQRTLIAKEAAAAQAAREANDTLTAELARQNQLKEELASERRQKEQAEALLSQLQTRSLQPATTVTLTPAHFERSSSSNLETFRVKTSQIKLRLVLEGDQEYEKYTVVITTFGGREVRRISLEANQVQRDVITITLPASVMGYDDFKIELLGAPANAEFQHIADYAFRLAR